MSRVEYRGVAKSFGGVQALHGFDLVVPDGAFLVMLGPSGCGKTTALVAGGLLAFALSFVEVVVTNFTAGAQETLPIWIFTNLSRPNQLPIVNVVALVLIILSMIPVYFAQRIASVAGQPGTGGGTR